MQSTDRTTLGTTQVDSYRRDGFIALEALFDESVMRETNLELSRFIAGIVPTMPKTHVYYENRNDPSTLKQIQKMFEYDGYFFELMTGSVIRTIAEELLQDDVVPVNLQYFNKPAGVSQATPAHQDGYYFHLQPCEAVTGWLALEDVDKETGCIHYVKGSHRHTELRPHGSTNVIGFSQGITDFGHSDDIENTVACEARAGTFLMHHARTIHYAGANKSKNRSRKALGFIYYAKRAQVDVASQLAYQKSLDAKLISEAKI